MPFFLSFWEESFFPTFAIEFTFHCWAVHSRNCRIFPGKKTLGNQSDHKSCSWPSPHWGEPLSWHLCWSYLFASAVQKELLKQKQKDKQTKACYHAKTNEEIYGITYTLKKAHVCNYPCVYLPTSYARSVAVSDCFEWLGGSDWPLEGSDCGHEDSSSLSLGSGSVTISSVPNSVIRNWGRK